VNERTRGIVAKVSADAEELRLALDFGIESRARRVISN
jgi:hypothetical protein